jgi:hypothetical protein
MRPVLAEHRLVDLELVRVRPDVALGRLRGFLHDVAELSGQRQAFAVLQERAFDVQHIAARFRPSQARCDARRNILTSLLRREPFRSK